MGGNEVIHMAPPAKQVPKLMQELLVWLSNCDEHPLIASSIFHYEFEFIHPFEDGIGRLWQSLALYKWSPLFANIPVENLVHAHQQEYYQAIQRSNDQSDSAPFIEFILEMILNAIHASQLPPPPSQITNQHIKRRNVARRYSSCAGVRVSYILIFLL